MRIEVEVCLGKKKYKKRKEKRCAACKCCFKFSRKYTEQGHFFNASIIERYVYIFIPLS